MKALAWDDKPQYLKMMEPSFERLGIQLVIATTEDEFSERFLGDDVWDFVITDLVLEDSPVTGEHEAVGHRIVRAVAFSEKGKDLPIFVVTSRLETLSAKDMILPPHVVVKSKSTYPSWLAEEIRQELSQRGLFVDPRRVFLIYGEDRTAPGTRGHVEHFLRKKGINVVSLGDSGLKTEIMQGLLNKMSKAGAFLALCTPDDEAKGQRQPRANVLIEIGMALGLSRGLRRLVLLQRWGATKKDRAALPSDLNGILTIRFEGEIDQYFETLEAHLRGIGIEI